MHWRPQLHGDGSRVTDDMLKYDRRGLREQRRGLAEIVSGLRIVVWALALALFVLLSAEIGGTPAAIISAAFGVYFNHLAQQRRDFEADQRTRQRELEARLQLRKTEAYQEFMNTFFEAVLEPAQTKAFKNKGLSEDDLQATLLMNPMMKQVALWGSDEVLLRYLDLIDENISGRTANAVPIMDNFGDMFLLLRQDVGYRNEGLNRQSFYPLFGIHSPESPRNLPLTKADTGSGITDSEDRES